MDSIFKEASKDIPSDLVEELLHKYEPFGPVAKEDRYTVFSLVNNAERHGVKFSLLGMVGWIQRIAKEYMPQEAMEKLTRDRDIALRAVNELPTDMQEKERTRITQLYDKLAEDTKRISKQAVQEFISRNFVYDPNLHVDRAAAKEPSIEEIREAVSVKVELAPEEQLLEWVSQITERAEKIAQVNELTFKTMYQLYERLKQIDNSVVPEGLTRFVKEVGNSLFVDKEFIAGLVKQLKEQKIRRADVDVDAHTQDFPLDTVDGFSRYMRNNYDALHRIYNALFYEDADVSTIISFHNSFDSLEEAEEYIAKNSDYFKFDVFAIKNGHYTIISPTHVNREKLNYYNENAEVVKALLEQGQRDMRIGKELMQKRAAIAKRKNIVEHGPDSPGFKGASTVSNSAVEQGAKKALSRDEELAAEEEYKKRLEEEYVQTNVFKVNTRLGEEASMDVETVYLEPQSKEELKDARELIETNNTRELKSKLKSHKGVTETTN